MKENLHIKKNSQTVCPVRNLSITRADFAENSRRYQKMRGLRRKQWLYHKLTRRTAGKFWSHTYRSEHLDGPPVVFLKELDQSVFPVGIVQDLVLPLSYLFVTAHLSSLLFPPSHCINTLHTHRITHFTLCFT